MTDLAGYNYDRGPFGERLDERYSTPIILSDAGSLRRRLAMRAGFLAGVARTSDRLFSDIVADWLARVSASTDWGDEAWVLRRDEVDVDAIEANGGRIREGLFGAYCLVENLDAVEATLADEND